MIDVVIDTLIDSVKLLPFLFVTYIIMEYLEHKTSNKVKSAIQKSGKFGPLIGGLLGTIPQCGFSVAATNLYATRIINIGTLLAVYLATSDEMIPIMISEGIPIITIIKILGIKLIIAVIVGFLIDLIIQTRKNTEEEKRLAHVTEDGVHFHDPFTGQEDFIGPEESMQIQCRIGADIHMAYDELTSLADTYEYNVESLARTERWAKRSLDEHKKHCDDLGYHQSLYGVIQGGRWEDLRRSTCKKYAQMDFDGYGLGGAFLKETLGDILTWCNEELPENKPRHLLGLSHPDDILIGTENGADTFDCVAPTREARHGRLYTMHGPINLSKYRDSDEIIDEGCDCPTCQSKITLGELRRLWKSQDRTESAKYFELASIHNLRFIIRLTEQARQAILDGTFKEFKEFFLNSYYKNK